MIRKSGNRPAEEACRSFSVLLALRYLLFLFLRRGGRRWAHAGPRIVADALIGNFLGRRLVGFIELPVFLDLVRRALLVPFEIYARHWKLCGRGSRQRSGECRRADEFPQRASAYIHHTHRLVLVRVIGSL